MNKIEIIPLKEKINGEVTIPGSKSYTNRALVMATLAAGESVIKGSSPSEDSQLLIKALRQVRVEITEDGNEIKVKGNGGKFAEFSGEVNLGAAGTSMRFFASVAALIPGEIILDGSERMRERPIRELVDALRSLGVEVEYTMTEGCPPIKIKGEDIVEGRVAMNGEFSSQYFTSLMMIGPVLENGLEIEVIGEQVSRSYIDMTIGGLKSFGVNVQNQNYKNYIINPTEEYRATQYKVEGDASGCSYFWAIAAITGSTVRVNNISKNSSQGDVKFAEILEKMGCRVEYGEDYITVTGTGKLKAVNVDMELMPDTAQTLAIVAAFAEGDTRITGLSTLRIKETDRIAAVQNELKKMGIETEIGNDFIVVNGGSPKGAEIETYKDHRMAMSFAVAGARVEGMGIVEPEVVAKSFPEYWDFLKSLGINTK